METFLIILAVIFYPFIAWFAFNLCKRIKRSWKAYRRGLTQFVMGAIFILSIAIILLPIYLFTLHFTK